MHFIKSNLLVELSLLIDVLIETVLSLLLLLFLFSLITPLIQRFDLPFIEIHLLILLLQVNIITET